MKKNLYAMLTLAAAASVMVGCSKADKELSSKTEPAAQSFEFKADQVPQAGKQEKNSAEPSKAVTHETPKKAAKGSSEFEFKPDPKLFPHMQKDGNK